MLQERTRLRRQLAEEIAADERAVRVAHADMLAKRRAEERLLEQARRMKPLASQAGSAPPHTEGEQTYVLPHPSETVWPELRSHHCALAYTLGASCVSQD